MDEKLKGILTDAKANGADDFELKRLIANYVAEKKKEDSLESPSADGSSVSQEGTERVEAPASIRLPRPGFNYRESEPAEVDSIVDANITPELYGANESDVVPKLRSEFAKYGFTIEEDLSGINAVTIRSSDGSASETFHLDPENVRYYGGIENNVARMREFVKSNAKGQYVIGDEDNMSKALRAKNLRTRPRITSEGEVDDTKMIAYEQDGVFYTVPTLFPKNPEKYTSMSDDWVEYTDPAQAIAMARQRGEVFQHNTKEEAAEFAKGMWREVSTFDMEADNYFKERGLDYMTIRNARNKYNEVNDRLDALEVAEANAEEEDIEPVAFVDGQKVDFYEYKANLEQQRDELFNVVFEDDAIQAQDEFDLYSAKQAQAAAKEAARLNATAKVYDDQILAASINQFGVPPFELGKLQLDDPQQLEQANYLYSLYQQNQATKESAARNYKLAEEYFDAQGNKMIQRDFAEGMEGVRRNWNQSWKEGEAGALMMAYHIASKSGQEYTNEDVRGIATDIARLKADAANDPNALTQGLARIQNARYWKEWLTGIDSPSSFAETVGAITTQSFSLMLPAGLEIAKVIIPSSVATGAAIGSAFPGVGTLVGAGQGLKQGIRLSFAAMNAAVEYNTSIFEAMSEAGYDLTDPEMVYAALRDEDVIARGRDIGVKRGLTIGAVDYLTAMLTGGLLKVSPMSSTAKRVGSATLNQAVFGPGGEALGEASAQLVAGQDFEGKEVFLEALGSLGNNSGNLALNMYSNISGRATRKFLGNLQNESFVQGLDASDERVIDYANKQQELGKITPEQNQRIQQNIGARREARKIMDTAQGGQGLVSKAVERVGSGRAKAETRIMELINARNRFESLGPTFSSLISDINKEIQEIAVTGRLVAEPVNIGQRSEAAVAEALRPKYIIDGQSVPADDAREMLARMGDEELLALARQEGGIRIENDVEFVTEINDRLNAIQEQVTAEVPVRDQPEVGEEVGGEVRRTEEPAREEAPVEEEAVEEEVSQLEELFGTAAAPTEVTPTEPTPEPEAEAAESERVEISSEVITGGRQKGKTRKVYKQESLVEAQDEDAPIKRTVFSSEIDGKKVTGGGRAMTLKELLEEFPIDEFGREEILEGLPENQKVTLTEINEASPDSRFESTVTIRIEGMEFVLTIEKEGKQEETTPEAEPISATPEAAPAPTAEAEPELTPRQKRKAEKAARRRQKKNEEMDKEIEEGKKILDDLLEEVGKEVAEAEAPAAEAPEAAPKPKAEKPKAEKPKAKKPKAKKPASTYKSQGKGRYITTIDGFDYLIEKTGRDEWGATEQQTGETLYGRTLKELKEIIQRLNDADELPHSQYGTPEVKDVNRSYESVDELLQDYGLNENEVSGLRNAIAGPEKGKANIKVRFERAATEEAPAAVGITFGSSNTPLIITGQPKNKKAAPSEGANNTEKVEDAQASKDRDVTREPAQVDVSSLEAFEASLTPVINAVKTIADPIRLFEKLQAITRGYAVPAAQLYLALSENPALTPAQRLIAKRVGETMRASGKMNLLSVSMKPVLSGVEYTPTMGITTSDDMAGVVMLNHPRNYFEAINGRSRENYNGRRMWEVMLHEGIHLVTAMELETDTPFRAEIVRINNLVINAIKADDTLKERFKIVSQYLAGKNNAFKNPHEILAWGMTNRDMQELLKTIEDPKGKTAWDTFVDAVRKALGLPDKPKVATALDSLFAAYATLDTEEKTAEVEKKAKPVKKKKAPVRAADKPVKVQLEDIGGGMSVGVVTKATSVELTLNRKTKQWTMLLTNKNGTATMRFLTKEAAIEFLESKTQGQVDAMTGRTGLVSEMREEADNIDNVLPDKPSSRVTGKLLLDDDGEPKVFYHGTDRKFQKFEPTKSTRTILMSQVEVTSPAFFFTEDKDIAAGYGRNIIPVNIRLAKPIHENIPEAAKIIRQYYEEKYDGTIETSTGVIHLDDYTTDSWIRGVIDKEEGIDWMLMDEIELINRFKEAGYDGSLVYEEEGEVSMSVFYNDNIERLDTDEADVQFKSETTGDYASEDAVAATVEAMNNVPEAGVLADIDLTQEAGEPTDVEGLNARLEVPLERVQLDVITGIPAMFTISDWLTSGSVTNPLTGNTIDNLQGGVGFNGVIAMNEGFAWANTSRKSAVDTLAKAKRVYEQNKELFDSWWKANPKYDGLVPVNVVRMLEDSNLSNEATFRVLIDNMRQLPKANRTKALVEYKRHLRGEIAKAEAELKEAKAENRKKKTAASRMKVESQQRAVDKIRLQLTQAGNYSTLDEFFDNEFNAEDGLFNSRNDSSPYTLGDRPDIMSLLTVGGIEPASRMYTSPVNPIVGALLGLKPGQKTSSISEERRRLLRFADVFGPLTEQATAAAPPRSIIAIVGIDVRQDDIAITDHPNYPYGTVGRSIGVVDTPVPVHMAYPSVFSKSVAASQTKVEIGKAPTVGQAISDGVAVQAGVSSNTFLGDVFEGNLSNANKLVRFLNLAFPNSNLFVSQEMFDAAMRSEGAQKQYALIGGKQRVIYGLTANGNVYINPEVHNSESELFNTSIHEFSHVWMDHLQLTQRGKAILARGYKLVQQTETYRQQLEKFGGDKQKAANEALAILIGNKGQSIVEASLKSKFKEFLNAVWSYVRNSFKLSSELTQSEIESMTLDGFIGTALADIFAGKDTFNLTDKQLKNLNDSGVQFSSTQDINDIVRIARENGFSDSSIKVYLKRQGFTSEAIKDATRITVDINVDVPPAFNDVVGGAVVGSNLFNDVMAELAIFAQRTNPTNAELRQKAQEVLKSKQDFKNQSDTVQKGMLVALDKSIGLSANQKVAQEIKAIRAQLRDRKRGEAEARAAQSVLRAFIKANISATTANRATVNKLIKLVSETNSANVQAQVLEAQRLLKEMAAKDAKLKAKLDGLKTKLDEARAKARSLKEAQETVRQFIRKALPRTDYGKQMVTKFNAMVAKATPDTINDIMEQVVEEVNKITVRNLNRDIAELLSTKTTSVVGGRLKGRLSPEAQQRFEQLKGMLSPKNANPEDVEKMVEEQQKRFDELDALTDMSEATLQEMFNLNIAIHYNSALLLEDTDANKVRELEQVQEDLTIFLNEEKSLFNEMIAEQKAYYNRIKSQFFTDVSGIEIDFSDRESVDAAREQIRQRQNLKDNRSAFVRVLKGIFSGFDSAIIRTEALEGLLDRVSVMPGEMFGGRSKELILDKLNDSSNILKAGKAEIYARLEAKQREIFGDKFDRKMREFSKQTEFYYTDEAKARELESVLEDTTTPTNKRKEAEYELSKLRTPISQNEMYYLYNQYKDEANHAGLRATLGPNVKEIMAQIESKLDPGIKEWADWQVNEFFPSVYERYNSVYKRIYRTNMPWNDKYAGRVIREREADNITDFSNFRQYQTRVGGQSTKVRMRNGNRILVRDGDNALAAYIGDMEFFHAYAENIRDIQKMIKSPEVKEAIEATTGEEAYKLLDGQLEKVMSRSLAKGDTVKMLDYFTNTYIVSKLGLNPTIYVKQMTSALAFADYIGYARWSQYAAKSLTEGVGTFNAQWKEMMANSVYLQERYTRSNITRVLENYTPERQDSLLGGHTAGKVNDFFMYLVKAGDMGGVMGSIPNYLFYKEQYQAKNPNATPQQVVEYAIKRVEDQIKSTQQSQDVQDKDFTQTDHYMLRFFNMFLSSSKALFRKEVIATRNLYRKMTGEHSKGTTKENVRTLLTYHVAIPMLFQYVALGFPGLLRGWREEDEEALTWAAILGNINAVFILGDIAVGISDAAQGRPWAGDMRTIPLLSDAGDIIQNYKKWQEAKTPETRNKYWMKIIETIIQTGTGIPFANIVKLGKNYKALIEDGVEDNGEALLRFLGYGDYQIEGPEKKSSGGRRRRTPSRGR